MKRTNNIWGVLISDDNLSLAIDEVNRTHHWYGNHRPNRCTAWVELTKRERIDDLRSILNAGFRQHAFRMRPRYDASSQKWRETNEPKQWPDQYIHHALIQAITPTLMRGMDPYCCGSIRSRGSSKARKSISKWMKSDIKGTKYCLQCDIYHFYPSLASDVVMARMRELIKDGKTLDLIERTLFEGVKIGAYTSQWYANTVLQPLDHMIREGDFRISHYERYMDNFTIFGPNKRKLHRLLAAMSEWLGERGLSIKTDWQIFRTASNIPGKAQRHQRGRRPAAVGFRYGRGYTLLRKRNLLRLNRALSRYRKRRRSRNAITFRMASGLLSRLGQLTHCNSVAIYRRLLRGERIQRQLKIIIRNGNRRELLTWNMFLEQWGAEKLSKLRVQPEPI